MAAKTHRYGLPRRVAEDNRGATGPFILGGASHATVGTMNIHPPNGDVLAHPQSSPKPLNPSVAVNVTVQCERARGEVDRNDNQGDVKRGKEVPGMLTLLAQLRFIFPFLPFFMPVEKCQVPEGNEESTRDKDVEVVSARSSSSEANLKMTFVEITGQTRRPEPIGPRISRSLCSHYAR